MTQHHLVQAPTRARRGPDLGGARVHSPARGPHSPLASPPLSPSRPRLSDAVRPGLPSAAGPTVRAPAAGGRTGGRARTLTRLQRPWRAPLPVGGCDGLRVTATRKAGDRLGPGFTQLRRRSSSSDRPSGSLPLASSQRHRGGGRAGGRESLAPNPRGRQRLIKRRHQTLRRD